MEKNDQLVSDLKQMQSEKPCCNKKSDKKNLIIGSSLLRNFDEAKLEKTEVRCLRGAYVTDIAKEVDAMASEGSSFSRMTLLCGGNDASLPADKMNLESTMDCYRNVISVAKTLAEEVVVTEIPPRQNPPEAQGNIALLNAALVDLSEQMCVKYTTNNELFVLNNGDINDGYLVDGTHLTLKGANRLAHTMGLKSRLPDKSVCSLHPQQTAPSTKPHNRRHQQWQQNEQNVTHKHMQEDQTDGDVSAEFWRTARQKAARRQPNRQPRGTNEIPRRSDRHTHSGGETRQQRHAHSGGESRQQRYFDCCDYCGEPKKKTFKNNTYTQKNLQPDFRLTAPQSRANQKRGSKIIIYSHLFTCTPLGDKAPDFSFGYVYPLWLSPVMNTILYSGNDN